MNLVHTKRITNTNTVYFCTLKDLKPSFLYERTGYKKLPDFNAEFGEIYSLIHKETDKKIILIGLGSFDNKENIVALSRKIVFNNLKLTQLQFDCINKSDAFIEQVAYGAALGLYNLNKNIEINSSIKLSIVAESNKAEVIEKAKHIASIAYNVMDLVNAPSNIKTPYYLADYCSGSAKANGFSVKIFKGQELLKQNLHAVYEVGRGSENPPAFVIMEHKPKIKEARKIGLIGKGISFDTGGISIKPSTNMHLMKSDMSGAAAVIGMMEIASKLNLPFHIIGIVPLAENAVGGHSYRPGDIIKTYSGKTIEVIDTDAEGRIILADALAYMVKNYSPEIMIDLATLTGSCVATLGYFAAGMFTNNDDLATRLYNAGIESHERVWRLPLWDDYKQYMASDMADIRNLSSAPVSGAITAAKFLEAFTENHPSWAHLDIAGVAMTDSDIYKSRTATAYGLRLLTSFIEKL